MLIVRLADDYLNGKYIFTWLLLVISLMASFCAVLFPRGILDEIWDLTDQCPRVFVPTISLCRPFPLRCLG